MQHRLLNTSILHIDNFHLAGDLTQTIYHLTWWRTLNSSTEQDNFPPAQGSCADNFRLTEALKYKHRTRQFTTCPGWILCKHSASDRGSYIHMLLTQQRHLNDNNSDGYLQHSLNVHVFKIQHTHTHWYIRAMGLKKAFWKEKGFHERFKTTDRGRMTDRNRELGPDNRSLVRDRALTTGTCAQVMRKMSTYLRISRRQIPLYKGSYTQTNSTLQGILHTNSTLQGILHTNSTLQGILHTDKFHFTRDHTHRQLITTTNSFIYKAPKQQFEELLALHKTVLFIIKCKASSYISIN